MMSEHTLRELVRERDETPVRIQPLPAQRDGVLVEQLTPAERKQRPVCSGVLDYFPDALVEVAHTSWVGNEQHNPGERLHWAKEKSSDEADALVRHLMQRGTFDSDGVRHSAKVAWRALALLQREIDKERADMEKSR